MEEKKKKITPKKNAKKSKKKTTKASKKKGFTLIELLAVIIILGILMIIAIPSVTNYINDSRKNAYVDTAKEIVSGTRNLVNTGKLGMYDTKTTYYIPASYINTENGLKSPYGEFTEAYVGVVYDGKGYKYYWISTDDTGQGIDRIILSDKLSTEDIVSDLTNSDIEDKVKTTGVGFRNNILILDENGNWSSPFQAEHHISENGESKSNRAKTPEEVFDKIISIYNNSDINAYFDIMPMFLIGESDLAELEMLQDSMSEQMQLMKEEFGSDFSASYEIEQSYQYPASELETLNNNFRSRYNMEYDFSECVFYATKIIYKGSIKEDSFSASVPLCKYDGYWYFMFIG